MDLNTTDKILHVMFSVKCQIFLFKILGYNFVDCTYAFNNCTVFHVLLSIVVQYWLLISHQSYELLTLNWVCQVESIFKIWILKYCLSIFGILFNIWGCNNNYNRHASILRDDDNWQH